ncbi:MAG: AAA family ATPase [Lachnospiraceae bacterium]|nr:AAA family ATPase [Lachnospiraceae bacterium]
MGIYLNPDNSDFQMALNSKIFVDKTKMIAFTNSMAMTEQRFISVSRPRRFGKSMAANMLTAYYSRGCDLEKMFSHLKIARDADRDLRGLKTVYSDELGRTADKSGTPDSG